MEEEYRRFTISVPKELAAELTMVKQGIFLWMQRCKIRIMKFCYME